MGNYSKAIVAFLGAAATLAAAFGLNVDWATPELISGVGGLITAVLVYIVPNKSAS